MRGTVRFKIAANAACAVCLAFCRRNSRAGSISGVAGTPSKSRDEAWEEKRRKFLEKRTGGSGTVFASSATDIDACTAGPVEVEPVLAVAPCGSGDGSPHDTYSSPPLWAQVDQTEAESRLDPHALAFHDDTRASYGAMAETPLSPSQYHNVAPSGSTSPGTSAKTAVRFAVFLRRLGAPPFATAVLTSRLLPRRTCMYLAVSAGA